MLYLTIEDFFGKASSFSPICRQEEIECARKMKAGDALARQRLIQSYLPQVAATLRRAPERIQKLGLVMTCLQAMEKAVDSFDFLQDSESFSHRLNWLLRQKITEYLVK